MDSHKCSQDLEWNPLDGCGCAWVAGERDSGAVDRSDHRE